MLNSFLGLPFGSYCALPEIEVLTCHLTVVVMLAYKLAALVAQSVDSLLFEYEVFKFPVNRLLLWNHVNDGPKVCGIWFLPFGQPVVFGFSSPYHYQSLGHSLQGVHGRGIGIELVENDVRIF